MQKLVGKIIYARQRGAHSETKPFIVLEQSSFALVAVPARGGVHSIFRETLRFEGPQAWDVVAVYDDGGKQARAIYNSLAAMLQDDNFNLSQHAEIQAEGTMLDMDLFLGVTGPASEDGYRAGLSNLPEDDSEDEARAAGVAAAEALEQRKLDDEINRLLEGLLPTPTIVIRCQTPEEVKSALSLLFEGRLGN